jgi:NADPH-dependent FMN reductase
MPDGTELVIFDGLKAVEPFDETDEHENGGGLPGADAFNTAIRDADAILFVTPEYNGSVAAIGASTGMFGAAWPRPTCASRSGSPARACSTRSSPSPARSGSAAAISASRLDGALSAPRRRSKTSSS